MDQSGYVRPGEVRSPRRYWTLSDEEPLYDGGENEWSAAWGEWTGEDGHAKRCIGVRWNGNDEKPLGHPSGHGHATWFILPAELEHGLLDFIEGEKRRSGIDD